MAKITPWEKRIREEMEMLARQLTDALDYVAIIEVQARRAHTENVSPVDFKDPEQLRNLSPPARYAAAVGGSMVRAIRADEEGDKEVFAQHMQVISKFTQGMPVELSWGHDDAGYTLMRELKGTEERYPLVAATWVMLWSDYLERYHDIVHLGVCRQCSKVYLKPKHGQKMRYCSRACGQKAYRERKKKAES